MFLDFYSHTSCGVRPVKSERKRGLKRFLLTHLMRGATLRTNPFVVIVKFLLTHLMRGATSSPAFLKPRIVISTHTPHARCDRSKFFHGNILEHFYSHTSCEVRRYSLLSVVGGGISTHTPHVRCDTISIRHLKTP